MPAHLWDIRRKCGVEWCQAWATHALRNTHNAVIDYFCQTHGPQALTDFRKKAESESDTFSDRF